MKQEIKEKWVAALRSGEYKQDRMALKTEVGYCCLGVLCDLYIKETGKGSWVPYPSVLPGQPGREVFKDENGYENAGYLSIEVRDWAELSNTNPVIMEGSESSTLASVNDSSNSSFQKIADLIEQQL